MDLIVRPHAALGATLSWGAGMRRCAIGPAGIAEKRREGDGVTPIGIFGVKHVLYRADKLRQPRTDLAVYQIARDDGWCDAPSDPAYNRAVKLPYSAGAENLWRDDDLYDVIVVLGFNDDPVVPDKGSAIFLHVAKPDYSVTQGCVALALPDLLEALAVSPDRVRILG